MSPSKDPSTKCGALTRKKTKCANPKGYKTDHVGTGKCFLHGGESTGAPKGNKNALTHGAYETLYEDLFTDDENAIRRQADVTPLAQARHEIRLLEVREYRMLRRIKDLRHRIANGEDLAPATATEETQKGWNVKGRVDLKTVHLESLETSVARYEAALTNVQQRKHQFITLLHNLEKADPPQDDPLLEFMHRMDQDEADYDAEQEAEEEGGEMED